LFLTTTDITLLAMNEMSVRNRQSIYIACMWPGTEVWTNVSFCLWCTHVTYW